MQTIAIHTDRTCQRDNPISCHRRLCLRRVDFHRLLTLWNKTENCWLASLEKREQPTHKHSAIRLFAPKEKKKKNCGTTTKIIIAAYTYNAYTRARLFISTWGFFFHSRVYIFSVGVCCWSFILATECVQQTLLSYILCTTKWIWITHLVACWIDDANVRYAMCAASICAIALSFLGEIVGWQRICDACTRIECTLHTTHTYKSSRGQTNLP